MELFRIRDNNADGEDEVPLPQEVILIDARLASPWKSKTTRLELDPKCFPPCRTVTIAREDNRLKIYAHGHMKDLERKLKLSFPEDLNSTELEVTLTLTPVVTVITSGFGTKLALKKDLDCSTNLSETRKIKIKCDFQKYLSACRTIVISKETHAMKIYGHGHSKKVENNIGVVIHKDIGLTDVKILLTPNRTGR